MLQKNSLRSPGPITRPRGERRKSPRFHMKTSLLSSIREKSKRSADGCVIRSESLYWDAIPAPLHYYAPSMRRHLAPITPTPTRPHQGGGSRTLRGAGNGRRTSHFSVDI